MARSALWAIGGCWLFIAPCISQSSAALLSAREALGEILRQSQVPPCKDADQLVASKDEDAMYLSQKLGQAGWGTVDRDYVVSLNVLFNALLRVASDPGTDQGCDRLRHIVSDLHTKRQDCEALGHSRTNIKVEIQTIAGNDSITGLEVYWRWLPAGDLFDTVPKRLEGMSSPALGAVPVAGEYELFAKDPASGRTTHPERVSIGGSDVFHWPLPVHFPAALKP